MTNYKNITREALKNKIDKKEDFLLIDTLGPSSYKRAHLPGATGFDGHAANFVEEVAKAAPEKDREIIVYCASFSCQLSPQSAQKLADAGYTNVYDYAGGLNDWAKGHNSFEGNEAEEMAENLRKED